MQAGRRLYSRRGHGDQGPTRTGRPEASGDAFALMVAEDESHVRAIERFVGQQAERVKLEDSTYRYTRLVEQPKPGETTATTVQKVRGARIRGGYYYGPVRRRR